MLHDLEVETKAPAAPAPEGDAPIDATACRDRAQLYRLLAAIFAQEPSSEFLAALRASASLAALGDAGLHFDGDFLAADVAALTETLACEYTTLFTAGGFPPVESVRLTGRLQQQPYFAVKQAYAAAGFAVERGRFALFDDHLGVELAFVAELLERAAGALDRGQDAAFRAIERDVKRFWALHLGKWVRGYAGLVTRAAEHSYFREAARLLHDFAAAEIALLRVHVSDEDGGRLVVPKSEVRTELNPDEPVCNGCAAGAERRVHA